MAALWHLLLHPCALHRVVTPETLNRVTRLPRPRKAACTPRTDRRAIDMNRADTAGAIPQPYFGAAAALASRAAPTRAGMEGSASIDRCCPLTSNFYAD